MSCQQTQKLIHPYLDGELDLMRSLEVERHLRGCQACSMTFRNQQALRTAITQGPLYHQVPAGLRQRVQSAVRRSGQSETKPWFVSWPWLSVGASLAAAAFLLLLFVPMLKRPSADQLIAQEVISAHVRSQMADHLTDVASSDRHTVKPWFNGRLDFSPAVIDLTEQGFPLIGGRLDYLNNRPVAALVYRRQQHLINLFIWPSDEARQHSPPNPLVQHGYHLVRWTSAGMTYWAISDLNEVELEEFIQLVRNQASPTRTP